MTFAFGPFSAQPFSSLNILNSIDTPTGVSGAGGVGSVTISAGATIVVTGVTVTGTVNTPSPRGATIITLSSGVSGTSAVNTPTGIGHGTAVAIGVSGTGTLYNISINADQIVVVTGVSGTGTVWSVVAANSMVVPVSGVGSVSAVGTLTVVGNGKATLTGITGTAVLHSAFGTNGIDAVAVLTGGATALAFTGTTLPYITDGGGGITFSGLTLALVGDYVGDGTIELIGNPINNVITYRNIPLALESAQVTTHTGPHHPTVPVPSTLAVGSPDCIVNNQYRLIRITDPATCFDQVTMNPALVDPTTRINELRERGLPPIP